MIVNTFIGSLAFILTIFFLSHECLGLLGELEYDGRVNIRLEHSFDHSTNPQYTHRGDIAIKSLHTGLSFVEQVPLTNEDIKALKRLAKKDGNYRLRATVKTPDEKQYTFLSFVKACSLIECHLSDVISVNLDHSGNVIAVTMAAPTICTGMHVDDVHLTNFNTSVFVRHMELGPIPDTASYIQKLEKEREAKERGESKDNRSFLGKYWMYILPVVIFILLPSATNQDAGGVTVPDPVFVSDDKVVQRSYRLEDFFWTGSGDGPIIEDSFNNDTETQENVIHEGPYETWRTTTVFHTTTILFATVYPKSPGCPAHGCKPHVSPVWTESVEFSSPVYPSTAVPDIMPSRTLPTTETSREKPSTTSSPLTFPATPKTLPPKATTATSRSSKEMKTSTSKSTSPTTPRSKPVDIPTTTKETTSSSKAPTTTTTAAAAKTKATTTSTTTTTTEPTTTTTSSTITTKKPIKKPSDPKREGNKPKDPTPSPKTDLEITEEPGSGFEGKTPPDQRYWILTVLKRDHYTPEIEINLIEDRLSSLYRKAFIRQQEKHLGINNSTLTSRQRRERRIPEPVRVHIHNVTRTISNDPNGVGLLYSVTVAGKPILALTAANDMRLLDIGEVSAELGFPVLTKAEPYLKGVVPTGARVKGRTRDTWLLIGSVVAAVSLLIILAALFTLGLSKKRSRRSASRGMTNRRHVFEGEEGSSNLAYQEDADLKSKSSSRRHHPKYEDAKAADGSGGTTVTFAEDQRRASTTSSSCSGSSEASLVRLRHQQRKKEQRKDSGDDKPRPRPRTRIRRVENADGTKDAHTYRASAQSASSAMSRDTYGGMTTEGFDEVEASPHKSRTPTSYLSMPSVKAFPRGARIPEPLSRVLEPISIRHLDADPDSKGVYPHKSRSQQQDYDNEYIHEARNKYVKGRGVARHGSLEGEDPGVIGPVVWDRHCQKINEIRQESLDPDEPDGGINIGKMRKRFNELLDDAFSMFGSRSGSPEDKEAKNGVISTRPSDNRVHSAIVRPVGHLLQESNLNTRPKTTDSRRPQTAMNKGPKGAWDSPNCRTPARPLSAGPFHKPSPVIDKNLILVDSDLSPSDPAVPLIAAIKDELKKFEYPLPGST